MVKAFVLLLLLASQTAGDDVLDYRGGSVRSPDRRWGVSTGPVDATGETMTGLAVLNGGPARRRTLMRFERSVQVLWPKRTKSVMLIERTMHLARVRAFALGSAEYVRRDRIQSDIVAAMARRSPRLGTVENRFFTPGSFDDEFCLAVEESGLPPGRSEGSFVARSGAFRIDFDRKRATPVAACPPISAAP